MRCQPCPAGMHTTLGSTSCGQCPIGQYSSSAGSAECTDCGAGQEASVGSTFCQECPFGLYNPSPRGICHPCPTGHVSVENRTLCVVNDSQSVENVHLYCPAGQEAGVSDTGFGCIRCRNGFSKATFGNDSCAECPDGTQAVPDFTSCEPLGRPSSVRSLCCWLFQPHRWWHVRPLRSRTRSVFKWRAVYLVSRRLLRSWCRGPLLCMPRRNPKQSTQKHVHSCLRHQKCSSRGRVGVRRDCGSCSCCPVECCTFASAPLRLSARQCGKDNGAEGSAPPAQRGCFGECFVRVRWPKESFRGRSYSPFWQRR